MNDATPASPAIRRIAISTGGGDAPGLNAVIRAVVLAALRQGWECVGIRDSYDGLLKPDDYSDRGLCPLDRDTVRGITHRGGTILGTTNRGNPFRYPTEAPDGSRYESDRSDEVVAALARHGIDALVAIGGDGSLKIAWRLAQKGVRVVGVPKTIDNDLERTVLTFGFDTAVAFATECIGRLHTTAEAHERVFVVEVMGRYAGWIALHAGLAGTADVILIPEIPYDIEKVAEKVRRREAKGRHFSIVVVAEGAAPVGGTRTVLETEVGKQEKLGGVGRVVAERLRELTGKETRSLALGHLLRGGTPTPLDRLIALRFGCAAVRALRDGRTGTMVALDPPDVLFVPLEEAAGEVKYVPVDGDTVQTARDLGVSLGD